MVELSLSESTVMKNLKDSDKDFAIYYDMCRVFKNKRLLKELAIRLKITTLDYWLA